MSDRMFLVVAYDIVSDTRRNRLVKLLKDYAGERVNFSVFECHIKKRRYVRLKSRINEIINLKEDSVLFYDLCLNCEEKREAVGCGKTAPSEMVITV